MKFWNLFWEFVEALYAKREEAWEPPKRVDVPKVDPWRHIRDTTEPKPPPAPSITPPDAPKPPTPTMPPKPLPYPFKEVLKWDTPKQAFHSLRVMCDEAGLPLKKTVLVNGIMYYPKDIICATVYGESRFNNKAVGKNKGSTDWGVFQVNDKFNIGKGKRYPSVQYVIDHPEAPAMWMIDTWKKTGKLQPWYAWSTGAFKTWLHAGSAMWDLRK